MLLTILLYASAYLAFGFLIATPLVVWITKERIDENGFGAPALMSVLFPLVFIVIVGELVYDALAKLAHWYVNFSNVLAHDNTKNCFNRS
jgi:hypothetical protein